MVKLDNFVQVVNKRFSRNGKPYYFLGTNLWYGMNLGSLGPGGDRARLVRELDRLKALGIENLRIMAGSEGPDSEPWRMTPSLQTAPGIYNQDVLDGLDFLLAEMDKRGMTAVMCLNNFWEWSGGMAQYVSWDEGSKIPYPRDNGNWDDFQHYVSRFYQSSKARGWFLDHIQFLLSRKNPYNGLFYKDDPAIMSWQIANEPRGMRLAKEFNQWIDDTASFIKKLDSRHLVTVGTEGNTPYQSNCGLDFIENHTSKAVDYMTVHLWIQNWNMYNPEVPSSYKSGLNQGLLYIKDHISKADKLGKPMVLEEFGLAREHNNLDPSTATTTKDSFYQSVFDLVYQASKEGRSVCGVNFWAWAGEGRPVNVNEKKWKAGNPWTGDPPHEDQGWYSVYDTDTNTVAIIQNFAKLFSGLNR